VRSESGNAFASMSDAIELAEWRPARPPLRAPRTRADPKVMEGLDLTARLLHWLDTNNV
jgi:hypothetical protein